MFLEEMKWLWKANMDLLRTDRALCSIMNMGVIMHKNGNASLQCMEVESKAEYLEW